MMSCGWGKSKKLAPSMFEGSKVKVQKSKVEGCSKHISAIKFRAAGKNPERSHAKRDVVKETPASAVTYRQGRGGLIL